MSISMLDIGWVAGILEGEGSFSTCGSTNRRSIRATVKMTDEDILHRLKSVTGVGSVRGPFIPSDANWGKKPYWTWCVYKGADVASLMMTVFPLMGERRKQRIEELLLRWRTPPEHPPTCPQGHERPYGTPCVSCSRIKNARQYAAKKARLAGSQIG